MGRKKGKPNPSSEDQPKAAPQQQHAVQQAVSTLPQIRPPRGAKHQIEPVTAGPSSQMVPQPQTSSSIRNRPRPKTDVAIKDDKRESSKALSQEQPGGWRPEYAFSEGSETFSDQPKDKPQSRQSKARPLCTISAL